MATIFKIVKPKSSRTDGMHKSAVDVGIEKVRHGKNGAVTQRTEVTDWTLSQRSFRLLISRILRTVVQQVHEQRKVPAIKTRRKRCHIPTFHQLIVVS